MSKDIVKVPLKRIKRMALVTGGGRSLEQVKAVEQPDLICNAGFFEYIGKPTHHLKADGVVRAKESWGCWGYAWDVGGDIKLAALPDDARENYIGGYELLTPMVGIQDALSYGAELGSRRGRTAMALDGENLILYCSGDGTEDAATPEELRAELYALGAETAIMLDGGGSSQCDFGGGQVIDSTRPVDSYLCVWLTEEDNDKEDKPVDEITQAIMTSSACYKAGRTITPTGIMVHSTGTPGAMADQIRAGWDNAQAEAAVHAIIDDGHTLMTLPWSARGWHAGTGTSGATANDTHIAFELCEPDQCRLLPVEWVPLYRGAKDMPVWAVKQWQQELQRMGLYTGEIDGSFGPATETATKAAQAALGLTQDGSCGPATLAAAAAQPGSLMAYDPAETEDYFEAIWNRAVSLCVKLCNAYQLDPMTDILCHAEGYRAGIASNHADVEHWWPKHGRTMDDFRAAVKAAMGGGDGQEKPETPQEPEKPQQPAADAPADWAAHAWEKAGKKIGTDGKPILDGTRPADSISRQELAVVLDRLGLLD